MTTSSYLTQNEQFYTEISQTQKHSQQSTSATQSPVSQSFALSLDNMILMTRKIESQQFKILITGSLCRPNGSPFRIPMLYASFFWEIVKGSSFVRFFLEQVRDQFTIGLKIDLDKDNKNGDISEQTRREIVNSMQQCRKFFILAGLIKERKGFSYKVHKSALNLKRNLAIVLKNKSESRPVTFCSASSLHSHNRIIKVNKIDEEISLNEGDGSFFRKGGYYLIQKKECKFEDESGKSFKKTLALKKARSEKFANLSQKQSRIKYELDIIEKIRDKKYLLNYYRSETNDYLAMDFIESNLRDLIQGKKWIPIKKFFPICKQIIQAVSLLHQSKIVHRDLKLENILIESHENETHIKLIDFGDSAEIGVAPKRRGLGCTIPYSPIECIVDADEGFNNEEIDLWSVPMIIYELIFKSLPVYYNRHIQVQLVQGWKCDENFTTLLSHSPKIGIRKLEEYVCLLAEQALKIEQRQRLPLSTMFDYMQKLEEYLQELKSLS